MICAQWMRYSEAFFRLKDSEWPWWAVPFNQPLYHFLRATRLLPTPQLLESSNSAGTCFFFPKIWSLIIEGARSVLTQVLPNKKFDEQLLPCKVQHQHLVQVHLVAADHSCSAWRIWGSEKNTHTHTCTIFWAPEKLWNFLRGIGLPHFCWADDLFMVLYSEFHGIPAGWVGDDRSNLVKQTFWTSNDHASSGTVRELQVSIAEGQTQQGVVEEGQWKHPRGPANIPRKKDLQKPLSPRQSQTQLRCHHCKWQWRNIMEHHLLQRRCFVF